MATAVCPAAVPYTGFYRDTEGRIGGRPEKNSYRLRRAHGTFFALFLQVLL
jgi:hypothetical protein